MIIYRGTDGDTEPVKCECEKLGWPETCITPSSEEETQFDNTHFKTRKEAWYSITRSVEAGKSINKRILKQKQEDWDDWQKQLKNDELEYKKVMSDKRNPWGNK